MDVARRRRAPAQGHRRGGPGAAGQTVGAVLRADVEVGLEGIEILSLSAAKPARSPEKKEGRIEVRGTPKRAPDVSVILAPGLGQATARRRR